MNIIGGGGAFVGGVKFKNLIDCSSNPNYPAANTGDLYIVSVDGKIGGASGVVVEAGDSIICRVDASPAGTQAAVGANWSIQQGNVARPVSGPLSAVDGSLVAWDGTTGMLAKDSGVKTNELLNEGLLSRAAQTLTLNETNRQITLTPTGASFQFVSGGVKFTKVGAQVSAAWDDTNGAKFIYFDITGAFVASDTPWTVGLGAPVAWIYWNTVTKTVMAIKEDHPNLWPNDVWYKWHTVFGTRWLSGLQTYATPLTSGTPNASGVNTCLGISGGSIADESIKHDIVNGVGAAEFEQDLGPIIAANVTVSNGAVMDIVSWDGTKWIRDAGTRFPFLFNGSNQPQYVTSGGVKTAVTEDNFFAYYIVATGDWRTGKSVYLVPHPEIFTSLALAQAGATVSALAAALGSLPAPEMCFLGRLIFLKNETVPSAFDVAVKYTRLTEVSDLRPLGFAQITQSAVLPTASQVSTDTAAFLRLLSATETDVQKALDKIDLLASYASLITVNDAARIGLSTDVKVKFTNLSTARQYTVPPANSKAAGKKVRVYVDTSCDFINRVDLVPSGADTIDELAQGVSIEFPRGYITLETDGISDWSVYSKSRISESFTNYTGRKDVFGSINNLQVSATNAMVGPNTAIGTNASIQAIQATGFMGFGAVLRVGATTPAVGDNARIRGSNNVFYGTGRWASEVVGSIEVVPTAAEDHLCFFGHTFDGTTAKAVDGIWIGCERAISAANFVTTTGNNSTYEQYDTGIPIVAGQLYRFTVKINAAGTQVLFYIDRVLVATHTLNIPSVFGRQTAECIGFARLVHTAIAANTGLMTAHMWKKMYLATTPRSFA